MKINYSLIKYILTTFPPPPLLSSPITSPHPWFHSLQKRADFQETITKHKIKYNKTSQKPSHQDWIRRSKRRKKVPKARKRVKDTLTFTVRSSTETPSNYQNIYTEDLVQIHAGAMLATPVSVSLYEPCLDNSS